MKRKKIAIGLFSNLKGLEIGAQRAGFSTPFSTDIDEDAQRAFPFLTSPSEKEVFCLSDINNLYFTEIRSLLKTIGMPVAEGDVDLLMGGPPCFGMTMLNTMFRSVFHHLNYLMIEMIRLVKEMQPKMVIIEQVPAILTKQMKPFYYLFVNAIERLGNYHWDVRKLNANGFGCYQSRKRVIFMLVRKDLGVLPSFPQPMKVDLSKQSAFAAIGAELIKTEMYKKQSGSKQRIIDGRKNVFPTLTSSKVKIFRNHLWQDLSLADRKILAHMEDFDMSSVLEEHILVKKLGMMVIPPFAEALCKHAHDHILAA